MGAPGFTTWRQRSLPRTIDTKMVPSSISSKEESLLLSRWWPAREASQARSLTTFLQGFETKHSPSQAHVLTGLSSAATAPDAILCLLKELEFPLWTLMQLPSRFDEVTDALTCFAFSSTSEGACLMAALSIHGLLPPEFPREACNLAVGIWFKLGGTQCSDCMKKTDTTTSTRRRSLNHGNPITTNPNAKPVKQVKSQDHNQCKTQ